MRKYLRAAAVMVGVMASAPEFSAAWAGEDELPEHVASRIRSEFPASTVVSTARRGGWWEASLVTGIRRDDLLIDPVGNIMEHHEAVPEHALPDQVRGSLARSHPRHTLWRATRITAGDDVFHQVLLARGERQTTLIFDPSGRRLAGITRG